MYNIAHVGLVVKDCEKSRDFYCDILGFEEIKNFQNEKMKIIFMRGQNLELEFIERLDEKDVKRGTGVMDHLAFKVDDIYKAMEDAKKKGVKFLADEPRTSLTGNKLIAFAGPDGERLEFMQPPALHE